MSFEGTAARMGFNGGAIQDYLEGTTNPTIRGLQEYIREIDEEPIRLAGVKAAPFSPFTK